MRLREFCKIGKNAVKQITNKVEYYIDKDFLLDYTPEFNTKASDEYVSFVIKNRRLSKSQILQFVYYHFCQLDSRGVIRAISLKAVAEDLGVSIRTVQNNNVVLEETGLISFSQTGNTLNLMIVRYPDYFTEGGSGFMELSYERFKELVAIEHVNSLRLELRKELIYDNHEIRRKYNKDSVPCKISFHDFKTFTPKYTHYNSKVTEIAEKGTAGYKTVVHESHIFFEATKNHINSKEMKNLRGQEYQSQIEKVIENSNCSEFFISTHIKDFVNLSFEYSIDKVLPALNELIQIEFYEGSDLSIVFAPEKNEILKNYGALLRTIIRRQISQKNQELAVPGEFIA